MKDGLWKLQFAYFSSDMIDICFTEIRWASDPFVCHPRGWAFQCLLLDFSVIFCIVACISLNFCFGSTCVNFFDQSYFLFLCSCSSRFWPGGWLLFSLDTPWVVLCAHLIVIYAFLICFTHLDIFPQHYEQLHLGWCRPQTWAEEMAQQFPATTW